MFFDVPDWDVGKPAIEEDKKKSKKRAKRLLRLLDSCDGGPQKPETKNPIKDADAKYRHHDKPKRGREHAKVKQCRIQLPDKKVKSKEESKLVGARFRFLNQKLYESTSDEALSYFQTHPGDFSHYHVGFREQTKSWPINPVDVLIRRLEGRLEAGQMIVDMGCGEARIASALQGKPVTVHSYDLVAVNQFVTVASMTNVPLKDESMDIVIFCLSLMNTDYMVALSEAHRILKPKYPIEYVIYVYVEVNYGLLR